MSDYFLSAKSTTKKQQFQENWQTKRPNFSQNELIKINTHRKVAIISYTHIHILLYSNNETRAQQVSTLGPPSLSVSKQERL